MYKEAMDFRKNDDVMEKLGFKRVFGLNATQMFPRPVKLYAVGWKKDDSGVLYKTVNMIEAFGFSTLSSSFLDIQGRGSEDVGFCFASEEYAEAVGDTLLSMLRKQVVYKGEKYFVIDWLTPREVGLHKENVSEFHLSDLTYCRLDELEF